MKALQVPTPGEVRLVDVEPFTRQPNEARLRLWAVGLCGSDLTTLEGGNPLVTYPRVIGHELAAEVLEVDDPTGRIQVGDLVTVEPYFPCGVCVACRRGRRNCCRNGQTLGVQREGCAVEEFCLPVEKLHKPPTAMDPNHLALTEPIGVGYHAARRGAVAEGDQVVVLGAGPIGLAAIQSARVMGAAVAAVDLKANSLALAGTLGAERLIRAGTDDVAACVQEWTGGDGADVVIEAVGAKVTIEQAVDLVGFAGRVVFIGYGAREVMLDPKTVVSKELDIRGSRNSLGVFPDVLSHLADGTIRVAEMISKTVALGDAAEALRDWAADPELIVKIVVTAD